MEIKFDFKNKELFSFFEDEVSSFYSTDKTVKFIYDNSYDKHFLRASLVDDGMVFKWIKSGYKGSLVVPKNHKVVLITSTGSTDNDFLILNTDKKGVWLSQLENNQNNLFIFRTNNEEFIIQSMFHTNEANNFIIEEMYICESDNLKDREDGEVGVETNKNEINVEVDGEGEVDGLETGEIVLLKSEIEILSSKTALHNRVKNTIESPNSLEEFENLLQEKRNLVKFIYYAISQISEYESVPHHELVQRASDISDMFLRTDLVKNEEIYNYYPEYKFKSENDEYNTFDFGKISNKNLTQGMIAHLLLENYSFWKDKLVKQ